MLYPVSRVTSEPGEPAALCLGEVVLIHHEAHEDTKKGEVKGVFTTQGMEFTQKTRGGPKRAERQALRVPWEITALRGTAAGMTTGLGGSL